MPKRKIRLEEIEAFVFKHDVTAEGRFKRGYQIHLGRITRKNGSIVSWACHMKGDIKWAYHFNPYMMLTMPICGTCLHRLFERLDDRSKALVFGSGKPPAYNMGVNSVADGGVSCS